jgi:hypothetical protein
MQFVICTATFCIAFALYYSYQWFNKISLFSDPDLTKGDGVYTRYFSVGHGGPGIYTFEVTVTDNGNTAYSWQETLSISSPDSGMLGSTHLTY